MSRDIEIASIKEAMNGADNSKMITPYTLNQVIKRKSGSSGTPGVGLNYYWNGTELGVKREDEQDYTFVDLQGPAGADGEDGAPGTPGADGTNGVDGDDGREIELQVTATHIQWRYIGDISWLNLIELSLLKGADGADGQGVPVGGTTGQVLKKKTNTDFDTEWGEAASVLVKATGSEVIAGTNDEKYVTPKAIKDGMMVSGDTLPIGSQVPFGSLTIPENWLLCDGSAISRVDYSELFAVIGTSYGAGNGTTTFNLPNKKGRTSVGHDEAQSEFNTVGKTGGAKTHTLTIDEMPSHNHKQIAHNWELVASYATGITGNEGNYTTDTSSTGGGQAHNNLQPYQTDVWIIKAKQSAGVVATVVDDLLSDSPTNALSANQGRLLNEVVLYNNNTTGTNGTVTLSETSANFKYLEIFYRDYDWQYGFVKVYQPNGKVILLNSNVYQNATNFYFKGNKWTISGTSITRNTDAEVNMTGSNNANVNEYSKMFIVRVVGYR